MQKRTIAQMSRALWRLVGPAILVLSLAGCITIGKDFRQDAVDLIKPGTTTMDEVQKMIGNPIRTGVDDGKVVWTYVYYRATVTGSFEGKDLAVKFDDQNKVTSISLNSTDVGRSLKR